MNKTIWLFGLPCSGKTTIAQEFNSRNPDWINIDGDDIRQGLNRDLKYNHLDRFENIRRIREMAKFLNQKGINVIVSVITPGIEMRSAVKSLLKNVIMVYCDCPLENCIRRDVKGMYKQAKEGIINNFTGINSGFDIPENNEYHLRLDTLTNNINQTVNTLEDFIFEQNKNSSKGLR